MSKSKPNRKFILFNIEITIPGKTYGEIIKELAQKKLKKGITGSIKINDGFVFLMSEKETYEYKNPRLKNNTIYISAFAGNNELTHNQIRDSLIEFLLRDDIDVVVNDLHSNKENKIVYKAEDHLLEVFFGMKYRPDLDTKKKNKNKGE